MTRPIIANNNSYMKTGWFFSWGDEIGEIVKLDDENPLHIHVKLDGKSSSEPEPLHLDELLFGDLPVQFAPTRAELIEQIAPPPPELFNTEKVSKKTSEKADTIIKVVETAVRLIDEQVRIALEFGGKLKKGKIVETVCELFDINFRTYYKYCKIYRKYRGDKGLIILHLCRSNVGKVRLPKVVLHLIDTVILRYYGAKRSRLGPQEILNVAKSVLQRTGGLWIDPKKCPSGIPENVVSELLNDQLSVNIILENPEKAELLEKAKLPSKSWFYKYLKWFVSLPDQGKSIVDDRYGKGTWNNQLAVFDTFVAKAKKPLEYVFGDHWLVPLFIVDKETRKEVTRLWLTVLIDAFTRCPIGIALLYEDPCIESIQSALKHGIFHPVSLKEFGIKELEWDCRGIPVQLFLDNCWAHLSHSLENLARAIGQGGQFTTIDLVFRPPYRGRYGALIERLFGNLAAKLRRRGYPGVILAKTRDDTRNAAREACLLYEDLERIIHELIAEYLHTPHSELGGMTPHAKWMESVKQSGIPKVPQWSVGIERLFLRMDPKGKQINQKGISAFGMHYWSSKLSSLPRIGLDGQPIEYNVRYDPKYISEIALFYPSHIEGGKFIGDLYARELRRHDGKLKPLSVCQRRLAQNIAKSEGKLAKDWLAYLREIGEQRKKRTKEKKDGQRQQWTKPKSQSGIKDAHEVSEKLKDPNTNVKDNRHDHLSAWAR